MHSFRLPLALALACAMASMLASVPANSADASNALDRIAGVYKLRSGNPVPGGEKMELEDILELVPLDADHAYFRMHLESTGGIAGIWGIATYSGHQSLVYDNKQAGAERCVFTISWTKEAVSTDVDYTRTPGCRNYHGVRASLISRFKAAGRRDIRYMERLRNSRQFKDATAEYLRGTAN